MAVLELISPVILLLCIILLILFGGIHSQTAFEVDLRLVAYSETNSVIHEMCVLRNFHPRRLVGRIEMNRPIASSLAFRGSITVSVLC